MVRVTAAEAQKNLLELLDKVEAGEKVVITRDGQPIAQVTAPVRAAAEAQPIAKKPIHEVLADLEMFRAHSPGWPKPSAEIIREMRDEE